MLQRHIKLQSGAAQKLKSGAKKSQIGVGITKWGKELQSGIGITKWGKNDKVGHNTRYTNERVCFLFYQTGRFFMSIVKRK